MIKTLSVQEILLALAKDHVIPMRNYNKAKRHFLIIDGNGEIQLVRKEKQSRLTREMSEIKSDIGMTFEGDSSEQES